MAATARARAKFGADVETLWTNDGFAVRLPETEAPPDVAFLLPDPDEVEELVVDDLGAHRALRRASSARQPAARCSSRGAAPAARAPLWQQRKRAADLLAVASRFGSFPILLETYRECLRDVFDLPALEEVLRDVRDAAGARGHRRHAHAVALRRLAPVRVTWRASSTTATRRSRSAARRRSPSTRPSSASSSARPSCASSSTPDALAALEAQLQHLSPETRARSVDGVADLLLRLGDLSREEIARRAATPEAAAAAERLVAERRALEVPIGGEERLVAVEDAARYRDALGVPLPPGVPDALLGPVAEALEGLVARYARRHAPFTTGELARRFGIPRAAAEGALRTLLERGRILEGAFRPHGAEREWCDPEVLRGLRRRSLARLREEIEPVEPRAFARMLLGWHGIPRRGRGLDAVLDAVEKLQGAPLPASLLETELLPARVDGYLRGDIDALAAAGEVLWVGLEPLGERDGRIALYLADAFPRLLPPGRAAADVPGERARGVLDHLARRGASFFAEIHAAAGGGYEQQTVDALWDLVWRGLVTNDTFQALRAYAEPAPARRERGRAIARAPAAFRSRRVAPAAAGGRWTLVAARRELAGGLPTATEWSAATAQQLLVRYGLVTRGAATAESLPGGFSAVYDVLRHLEESGRIRRGYFVAGVGAMQFAQPGVLDLLRSLREPPEVAEVVTLAATDPANPYGALLEWPDVKGAPEGKRPARSVGASVVLVDGELAAHVSRGARQLFAWLPEFEPERSHLGAAVAAALTDLVRALHARDQAALVVEIDGGPAVAHPLAGYLQAAGFVPTAAGLQLTRRAATAASFSAGGGS